MRAPKVHRCRPWRAHRRAEPKRPGVLSWRQLAMRRRGSRSAREGRSLPPAVPSNPMGDGMSTAEPAELEQNNEDVDED
eukprot:1709002-Alexandrium_andersonii.AAC.1